MLNDRFVIGFCCTAMQKEPVTPVFESLASKIKQRKDYFLLVYHCFDELYFNNPESIGAGSVFDNISYDILDVMIVMKTSENQGEHLRKVCRNCRSHNIPVISIDEEFEDTFCVSYSYGEAFAEIVEHVISAHGCKKIKHIAGLRDNDFSKTRIDCCAEVMARHGLTLEEKDVLYGEFWDTPTYKVMDEFFESGEELPDAFICANDSMAIAVCQKLTEHGYSIPEDVIVTGFDGIEIEKYHSPRLTTAVRDTDFLVDEIFDIINTTKKDKNIKPYTVPVSYTPVFSESCGCKKRDSAKSTRVLTDYVRRYGFVRGYEETMNKMGNMIAYDPSVENAREVMRKHTFGQTTVCVYEQFNVFAEAKATDSEDEIQKRALERTDNACVLIECVDASERKYEGVTLPCCELIPNLYEKIPENNILMVLPLYSGSSPIGYFVTYYVEFDTYLDQLYTYNMMANRCLEVVRTHEHMRFLNRKMEYMFTHDHLTGIFNRYGFYKNFKADYSNSDCKDIFIASVDLNDMKLINDNYGHSEGDEALRITADALSMGAEATDKGIICSRFGGDEFVVAMLCGGDAAEKAEAFNDNFKNALTELNETLGKPYKVSASIGVCSSPLDNVKTIDELIELADVMMYNDKARHKRRPKKLK